MSQTRRLFPLAAMTSILLPNCRALFGFRGYCVPRPPGLPPTSEIFPQATCFASCCSANLLRLPSVHSHHETRAFSFAPPQRFDRVAVAMNGVSAHQYRVTFDFWTVPYRSSMIHPFRGSRRAALRCNSSVGATGKVLCVCLSISKRFFVPGQKLPMVSKLASVRLHLFGGGRCTMV